jgi:hypothetical protein
VLYGLTIGYDKSPAVCSSAHAKILSSDFQAFAGDLDEQCACIFSRLLHLFLSIKPPFRRRHSCGIGVTELIVAFPLPVIDFSKINPHGPYIKFEVTTHNFAPTEDLKVFFLKK